MKQYPKYKDSEIEWLKDIPEHWERYKLKHTVKLNPSKSNSSLNATSTECVVFLPMEKVEANGIFSNDIKKPVQELWNGFTYFEEGDVIFAKITPCFENGKGAILNNLGSAVGFGSTEFHVLRAIPKMSLGNFIYYLTFSHPFRIQGEAFMTGAAGQKRVPSDFAGEFLFGLPSLHEQQAISSFLDQKTSKIDNLVSIKKKQIELLKEERVGIINQAVTKSLNPKAKMKDSGIEWLGEIPEHWNLPRLKWLSKKIGSGVTPRGGSEVYQDNGIPLIRSQNVHFDGLRLDDVAYISEEIYESMIRSAVEAKDVLLNITGASIGRCTIVPDNFGLANVNQHVCIIRPIDKRLKPEFLNIILSSFIGQSQVFNGQNGAAREGLNYDQLGNFIILCQM